MTCSLRLIFFCVVLFQAFDGVMAWNAAGADANRWEKNNLNYGRTNGAYGDDAARNNAWQKRTGSE